MNKQMMYEKHSFIAPITDQEITEMLKTMKPALYTGEYRWCQEISIEGIDYRRQSYIWDRKFIGECFMCDSLETLIIPTFHAFGAPSLFKPSLAETLGAIRRYCTDWSSVKYFILESDLISSAVFGSCHQSRCHLSARPLVIDVGTKANGILKPMFTCDS